jgi:hypothetical protein
VENEFTKYFLDNKEQYLKQVNPNYPITNKECKILKKKLCDFYHTLEKKVPEMAKKYKVEEENIINEINYWVGAYKHGQLDALDDILGTN